MFENKMIDGSPMAWEAKVQFDWLYCLGLQNWMTNCIQVTYVAPTNALGHGTEMPLNIGKMF